MLMLMTLAACEHPATRPSTGATAETGASAGPTDPDAYADITFTYQPVAANSAELAFTLREGDPVTGSRYADQVEATPNNLAGNEEWLRLRHVGCPDGYGTESVTLTDRPPYFDLHAPFVYEQFAGDLELDLNQLCDPSGTRYALWCREDIRDPTTMFEVTVTEDDGELVTGTVHAQLTCVDKDGSYATEGSATIDADYVARRITE